MSEIDGTQVARKMVQEMHADLTRQLKALPWFSWRRMAGIRGASDALFALHSRLCDHQMETLLKRAAAIRTPSTGEEQ